MRILLAILLLSAAAWGQAGNAIFLSKPGTGAPVNPPPCAFIMAYVDATNGDFYDCNPATGLWLKIGPTVGGAVAWNSITAPTGNLALAMSAWTTAFTWNAATGAGIDLFKLADSGGNTGTGVLLKIDTALGSSLKPFQASVNGNGVQMSNTGVLAKLGTGSVNADQCNGVACATGTVTNVTWTGGIVSIANPATVPAFTIAGTSGGIPYFSGATTWASSGVLTAEALVAGGGAGLAPHSQAGAPVRGSLLYVDGTPAWIQLTLQTSGKYPKWNGTDLIASTLAASGIGACAGGQAVTTLNADAAPTCTAFGGGTPGGANTNIQYNDSGAFGGDAHLTYTKATGIATIAADATGGLDFVASAPAAPAPGAVRLHSSTANGFTRVSHRNEMLTDVVMGRDSLIIGKNTSGGAFATGQVVYVTGSTGNVPNFSLAKSNSLTTLPTVGVVVDAIANNAFGPVMTYGIVSGFNTNSFTSGDQIYVDPTTAGAFTATRPVLPNYVQRVGTVLVSGVGNGSILVAPAPFIGSNEVGTNQTVWAGRTATLGLAGTVSGSLGFVGTTSGSATIQVAAAAGTPNPINLPTATGAAGSILTTNGANPQVTSWAPNISSFGCTFDGGGSTVTVNSVCYGIVPAACTIAGWDIQATGASPTTTLDIWRLATGGTTLPVVGGTLMGTKPALASGNAVHSTTLTGWTTSLAANDRLAFNVDAVANATSIIVTIQCNKT